MEAVAQLRKLVLAGAVAALAVLASSSPALAKGGCPGITNEGPSSVQQYVEQTHSACGSNAVGTGTHETKLPAPIKQKIEEQGGSTAEKTLLENVATKEQFGAPTRKLAPKQTKAQANKTRRILTDSEARHTNPLSASFSVVTDGSDARLIALVVLMIGIAAIVLGSAVRRRRVSR